MLNYNTMLKEDKIKLILKKSSRGMTITEIVGKSRFSRSTVRNVLAKLEGARKVSYRKIGMAKIYSLNGRGRRK